MFVIFSTRLLGHKQQFENIIVNIVYFCHILPEENKFTHVIAALTSSQVCSERCFNFLDCVHSPPYLGVLSCLYALLA